MNAKEIQDLISFIAQSGLDEVNIETDQLKLAVRKHSSAPPAAAPFGPAPPARAAPYSRAREFHSQHTCVYRVCWAIHRRVLLNL